MILLVHKEEETMNFLHNMGVDVSRWRFGLRDILMPEVRGTSLLEGLFILTFFYLYSDKHLRRVSKTSGAIPTI